MKSAIRFAWLSAALAICALPVVGQSADASVAASTKVTGQALEQRQDKQQDVIANGVKDGKLTAGEATRLENKEADLDKEESAMKKVDDGHLTTAEKEKITRQQDRITQQIKQSENNSAKQPSNPVSVVGKREGNQQDRIAQGVKSGALSATEAAQLEKNEAKINSEVRQDRAANGGKLTTQEKAQINNQLNHQSMQIHQAMHGGGHR